MESRSTFLRIFDYFIQSIEFRFEKPKFMSISYNNHFITYQIRIFDIINTSSSKSMKNFISTTINNIIEYINYIVNLRCKKILLLLTTFNVFQQHFHFCLCFLVLELVCFSLDFVLVVFFSQVLQ